MDIVCKNCKQTFSANPIEMASASVNYNLGRTHTFKCDHCKADNTLTKAEFEAIRSGKPAAPAAAAKPAAAAPNPVARPAAPAVKPAAAPMPAHEMDKVDAPRPAPMTAGQPREGTVLVGSLHVRKDHSTTSETVAGLVKGNKVKILGTWTDGKNTWAQIGPDQWAAIEHNGQKMIDIA